MSRFDKFRNNREEIIIITQNLHLYESLKEKGNYNPVRVYPDLYECKYLGDDGEGEMYQGPNGEFYEVEDPSHT